MADDGVKGMGEAAKQAEAGLKLFKTAEVVIDTEGATAFKVAEDEKIAALEEAIKGLSGKDNKKAKTEKQKELKAIKDSKEYIDAEKIVKGKEPQNGFWMKKIEEKEEEKPEEETKAEEKKETKEKKEKPKKAQESCGISPDERKELDTLKNDIIARKKELKEQGMSGGQQNKDEQVAAWVKRMNELKEKENPGSTAAPKKDKSGEKTKVSKENAAAVEELNKEIEEYREKLVSEFKYSKKEITADPDMKEMQERLKKLSGKK